MIEPRAADFPILVDFARSSPADFVETILGMRPWVKQKRILEAVRDFNEINVQSCHGAGKSATAADGEGRWPGHFTIRRWVERFVIASLLFSALVPIAVRSRFER